MDLPRFLILETSHRAGCVAVALGPQVLGERRLDESLRDARDLVPACAELLAGQGWKAGDLAGVIVSRGPGSYTGLRVGVMSAKTLAYAANCALLGIDTFAALALPAPAEAKTLDVVADAQQDKLYVQRFVRADERSWLPQSELTILSWPDWLATLTPEVFVTGPGLENHAARLPTSIQALPPETWIVKAASLFELGLARWQRGERDDPFALEPLYLRPSSAEEKWASRGA